MFKKLLFSNRHTYIERQLGSVAFTAMVACVFDYFSPLITTLFVGKELGEQGLVIAGVTNPIYNVSLLLCNFIPTAGIYLKEYYLSRGEEEKAERFVGTSISSLLILGTLISTFCFFGGEFITRFFSLQGESAVLAASYIRYYSAVPLLSMLQFCTYEIVFRSGNRKYSWSIVLGIFVSGILGSILGLKFLGINGVAISLAFSSLVGFLIGLVFVIKHWDECKFKLVWDISCFKEMFSMGYMYSQMDLYYLIYSTAMYAFLGRFFGEGCIAVFSLLDSMTDICSAFYGVPYAMENYLSIYMGENNRDGIEKLLSASLRIQCTLAVCVSALTIIFARPVAVFFEMDENYAAETIFALRIYAAAFIFYAVFCLLQDYYASIELLRPSIVLSAGQYLIIGLVVAIPLGLVFGSWGIYAAKFIECPFALLLTYLYIKKTSNQNTLFVINVQPSDTVSKDFDYVEEDIIATRDWVEAEALKRGIDRKLVYKMMLSFEENSLVINNINRKRTFGECTLIFEDACVKMILRDNGKAFDASNLDNCVNSMQSYVLSSLARENKNQFYLFTANSNRITYNFDRTQTEQNN